MLKRQAESGKRVIGYGASTKGNVLLQYYGITTELLPCIADANSDKWGLCTIGSGIQSFQKRDACNANRISFCAAMFFINYFIEREKELLARGTRFVVPLPELKVVE